MPVRSRCLLAVGLVSDLSVQRIHQACAFTNLVLGLVIREHIQQVQLLKLSTRYRTAEARRSRNFQ
jgi:hypothetical protein